MYNIVRVEASCSLTKMLIERVVLKSYIVAMIIEMIEINRKQNFNTKNAKKRKIIARDIQCLSPAKTKEKEAKVLLDALYEEGIIPTYSFPKNVVSTYIMNEYGRTQYEIERGLDIAIDKKSACPRQKNINFIKVL